MFLSLWPTYLLRTVLYLLSGWRGDKLWVPERSAVNRCRERFWRVEVRVLRRSYLISRAAYLYPSHSLPVHLVYSRCSSESACGPSSHPGSRSENSGWRLLLHLQKSRSPTSSAYEEKNSLKSSVRALFFLFLSRLDLDELLTQMRPFL